MTSVDDPRRSGTWEAWRAWRAGHGPAAEALAGLVAGAAVTAVGVWQWGTSGDALLRAASIGTWLGLVVWIVARRRRVADERARAERIDLRLDLARELHDTVAGEVAAIGIQAAAARRIVGNRPDEAAVALERIEVASRTANADLRRMLEALREGASPPSASPGLAAIRDLVDGRSLGRGGATTLELDPAALAIEDTAVGRAAYRIVEEAMRNAMAHAGAVPIHVRVLVEGGELRLDVVNEPGRAGAGWPGSGMGLVGIRERAALYGGRVDAGPTPDGGYRLAAALPLQPAAPASADAPRSSA
jgi:signal transduction histidine kinase